MIKDKNEYHILVVEDNPGDIVLIGEYLNEQIDAPKIQFAKNFSRAAAFLQAKNAFDIILLDLTLPDKEGRELITEIVKLSEPTPVIILTDFSDLEFSIRSFSLGVSDYLLKSDLNASSLFKSILYCLERRKKTLELKESEKRYSDLFKLNPLPMWIYELETFKLIQVNHAAIELYGYTEEEFLNMTVLDLKLEEDYSSLRKTIKQHEGNKPALQKKTKHFTKSGHLLDVEIQANFININNKKYRMVIITDVTEKNRMEQEITKAIINTQENERYEIGAELHDNICQILATTHISLGVLKKSLNPEGLDVFQQCRDYIKLATSEIRNLSHRLAPAFFNDSTLEEAFGILLKDVNIENKYEVSFYFDPVVSKLNIDHDLQLNLYRILQEQLRNILKYANCKHIEVEVFFENNNLIMRTTDDGVGFDLDTPKEGIGISNMKRRTELFHGTFKIYSSPGKGCQLKIKIPIFHGNQGKNKSKTTSALIDK